MRIAAAAFKKPCRIGTALLACIANGWVLDQLSLLARAGAPTVGLTECTCHEGEALVSKLEWLDIELSTTADIERWRTTASQLSRRLFPTSKTGAGASADLLTGLFPDTSANAFGSLVEIGAWLLLIETLDAEGERLAYELLQRHGDSDVHVFDVSVAAVG